MANNEYVNKVIYGNNTLIDITDTTADESNVASGAVFYKASGLRATGTAKYAGSATIGGSAINTAAIPFAHVDSTSTSTAFTASVPEITSLYDGVAVLLKNGVVTSESGFTININNLGAKHAYSNLSAETAESTIFNVNYTMLFVYDSTRVTGGGWICYRGYDSNTNTIGYQLRTNSAIRPAADKGYRYRLWFTSLDGHSWVPANTSTSTNNTTKRTPNTRVIDPFGEIIYYSTNGTTNAGANLTATACWQQYTLSLGYSFNSAGVALTLNNPAPVYVKCTPQTSGGVVMNDYVQTLPSTADGKVYIFLGMAYSATSIELAAAHPVYEYKDGAIRLWTNAPVARNIYSDTKANWDSQLTYVPSDGDIIIYIDKDTISEGGTTKNVPGIKIGDGNAYCVDLPFVADDIAKDLYDHIDNASIHVSSQDRSFWDNKLNLNLNGEILEFNRN